MKIRISSLDFWFKHDECAVHFSCVKINILFGSIPTWQFSKSRELQQETSNGNSRVISQIELQLRHIDGVLQCDRTRGIHMVSHGLVSATLHTPVGQHCFPTTQFGTKWSHTQYTRALCQEGVEVWRDFWTSEFKPHSIARTPFFSHVASLSCYFESLPAPACWRKLTVDNTWQTTCSPRYAYSWKYLGRQNLNSKPCTAPHLLSCFLHASTSDVRATNKLLRARAEVWAWRGCGWCGWFKITLQSHLQSHLFHHRDCVYCQNSLLSKSMIWEHISWCSNT